MSRAAARCAYVALLWLAAGARADDSVWLGRPNPLYAFVPSAAARTAARAAQGEVLLAQRLQALPGVRSAQVRLMLPAPEQEPLDRPSAPARASVLLQIAGGPEPTERELAEIAAHALPELTPLELSVRRVRPLAAPAPPAAASVRVGPFRVAAESAVGLRAVLGASLLVNAGLAALLLWRRRRAPRR